MASGTKVMRRLAGPERIGREVGIGGEEKCGFLSGSQ